MHFVEFDSSDEQGTILCDACNKHIEESKYIIHWQRCKDKNKKRQIKEEKPTIKKREVRRSKQKVEKEVKTQQESEVEKIPCTFCGYMMNFAQLDTHPNECAAQNVTCEFCDQDYPNQLLQQHYNECEARQEQMGGSGEQGAPGLMVNNLDLLMWLFQALGAKKADRGLNEQQRKKLKIIKYEKKKGEDENCTVCMCEMQQDEDMIVLECKHIFHMECIKKWLENHSSCPNCKKDLKQKQDENQKT